MLVAGGATLTVKDRRGNTPRDLALQAEDRDLAAYLYSKCFSLFLCAGDIKEKMLTRFSMANFAREVILQRSIAHTAF